MKYGWLLAEFIGTFTLIFIGVGAVCLNEINPSVGVVGIALAHGLAIAVMVTAFAHISGGKLNPAVSLGVFIGGKNDIQTTLGEILAQLAGAVVGALCIKAIFPVIVTNAVQVGTPSLNEGFTVAAGILAEAIFTFLLLMTVYSTVIDPRGAFKAIAGFAVGSVIIFDILVGAGITGAAINPARAFGPALVSWNWDYHYIYWIGPILGGLAGGYVYSRFLLRERA